MRNQKSQLFNMMEHQLLVHPRSQFAKMVSAVWLAVTLCCLILLSLPATAQTSADQDKVVCLYSQTNFRGNTFCSDSDVRFLPLGFTPLSIKLKPGYEVTAYKFQFYLGRSVILENSVTRSRPALASFLRSFKITKKPVNKKIVLTGILQLLLLDDSNIDPNDLDGDGFSNELEEQFNTDPKDPNSTPPDLDGDKIPDPLDSDIDGDGVENDEDAFPNDPDETSDLDGDGIGDNADLDLDGDGVDNPDDAFPQDPDETSDIDNDGVGDNADTDRDGDGVDNDEDAFPTDPDETSDLDEDGEGDNSDTDIDGDGADNGDDAFPQDPDETTDSDNDGVGDNADTDRDGDGVDNDTEEENETNPDDGSDFPDLVAPLLTLNIDNNLTVTLEKILITGTLIDPEQPYSGLQEFFIESSAFSDVKFSGLVNQGSGAFSIEVPLIIGENTLSFYAVDESGNETRRAINVTRQAIPTIVSIQPVSGTVVTEETTTITGSIHSITGPETFELFVNDSQVIPQTTSDANRYDFDVSNVTLQIGDNHFNIRVSGDFGGDQQNVIIKYRPDMAEELAAPSITSVLPSSALTINQDSFRVGAQIQSVAGPLTVSVNGQVILDESEGLTFYPLDELVSFVEGETSLSLLILAKDNLGKATELSLTYYRDLEKPSITIDQPLQLLPSVNTIDTSEYLITGTVSDNNLAGLVVNGEPLELSAGSIDGEYTFEFNASVTANEPGKFEFYAFDRSRNIKRAEYSLVNTASVLISSILPLSDSVFLAKDNQAIPLQVAARHEGLKAAESIVAYLQTTPEQIYQLAVSNTLASGDISLPAISGSYTIVFEVRDADEQRITSDSLTVEVQAAEDISFDIVRIEPSEDLQLIEPNTPIEVYFNQEIDLSKLEIQVKETLYGKSYINADELGQDFISSRGYVLTDVSRDHELVSGQLSLIPGGAGAVFSPSRNYGYNADLSVEVIYEGKTFNRSRYKVRELPTFINGSIVDQFGQPLSGIRVSLPELKRETVTNGDGGFAFGYQETAEQVIDSGRYSLVVNDDFVNPRFGTRNTIVSVQKNRVNALPRYTLQELDQSISFVTLDSSSNNVLLGGDLEIDFSSSQSRAIFPDTRTSGSLKAQFLSYEHLGVNTYQYATPNWLYGLQPRGIQVEGDVKLKFNIPKLRGGYDYIDSTAFLYVVLLGFNEQGQVVEPIGVGEIVNNTVESRGIVHLDSLDYLGYSLVFPGLFTVLEQYANGEIPIQLLKAELRSQFENQANEQSGR